MPRITFNEIARTAEKAVKCAGGCGRRVKRRKKFWQTLNPYNRNKAGVPKTRDEIEAEVVAEAKVWQAAPETCVHCRV